PKARLLSRMSQQQPISPSRPIPPSKQSRRRIPPSSSSLLRRPGPQSRTASAPTVPQLGGRLRDVSLANLLDGVDQVPSARKRHVPASAGVLATGTSRRRVMQAKVAQR